MTKDETIEIMHDDTQPSPADRTGDEASIGLHRGMEFWDRGGISKIMAVEDNWVMARKKGCIPFTIFYKEVIKSLEQMLICLKGGEHKWGTDGKHLNKFCKKCFMDKPATYRVNQ